MAGGLSGALGGILQGQEQSEIAQASFQAQQSEQSGWVQAEESAAKMAEDTIQAFTKNATDTTKQGQQITEQS
jgi:hypothetical protein